MNIAIITARGGSKRIPRKNIRLFAGRPMLAWPLLAAQKAAVFDRIIVSTDSEEIAATARDLGAEVPFLRPAELADDHTPTAPVLLHALDELEKEGCTPNCACCIYPTAPFLLASDLQRGHEELGHASAPSAVSVTTFDFPILRAFERRSDGTIAFHWPEYAPARSQDLPEFYHDAGQFYWFRVAAFRASGSLIMPGTRPVVLPRSRVQDIDTPEDWETAERMALVLLHKQDSHIQCV